MRIVMLSGRGPSARCDMGAVPLAVPPFAGAACPWLRAQLAPLAAGGGQSGAAGWGWTREERGH